MLYIVGIGPGSKDYMSSRALEVIEKSQVIVGYTTYVKLIEDLIKDKEVVSTGMTGEVHRCRKAIEIAESGRDISLISSGDSGIYGMAGLVFEILESEAKDLAIEIVPGITASIAGAASVGAPLMNDFCNISLSDLLTPWEMIEERLEAAAKADFVICLYNPRSKGRPDNLRKALDIISQYKDGDTYLAVCIGIGREEEEVITCQLKDFGNDLEEKVGMTTVVIVGNKYTRKYKDYIYTKRGYDL